MSKKESVEFQIYKSDVMNAVREQMGEDGERLAKLLFEFGEDDYEIGLVLLAFKAAVGVDGEDMHRIAQTLTITRLSDKKLYNVWIALFLEMFNKKFKKEA